MQNGPVCINQTYSTFPMSLPSVIRPKRVLRELFRLQLFSGQVGRQTLARCSKHNISKTHRITRCREHMHTYTHDDKKKTEYNRYYRQTSGGSVGRNNSHRRG